MKQRRGDWRFLILLAILLLVPLASRVLLARVDTLHTLELLVYDWHNSSMPQQAPDPRLIYVGMDDGSLDKLGLPLERQFYPLPRRMHANVVDELRLAGAKVIGYDVMFTRDSPRDDAGFAAALARQGAAHTKPVLALRHESHITNGIEEFEFDSGLPQQKLRPHVVPASITAARYLEKVRWFPAYPADAQSGTRYLQMPVALAASYFGEINQEPQVRSEFRLGRISAPLGADGNGEVNIRFSGPARTFKPVPFHEVYNGTWKQTRTANFFRDKIVLIGRDNPLEDHHSTPWGEMSGTEILLHETQTLLLGNQVEHWSEGSTYLLKVVLCAVLIYVVLQTGLRWAFWTLTLLAGGWVLASHQMFLRLGIWADTVEPIGALMATYILVAAIEAHRMRLVFHRFLPSRVAEQMLRANLNLGVQTAEREATIVFCDVRDYTRLSEFLPLETVEEILHRYFSAGEVAAFNQGSEIDKFVGDEVMLFFEDNLSRRREDRRRGEGTLLQEVREERRKQERREAHSHAVRAVLWALEMQEAAKALDASGIAVPVGFRVGIGICTGVVRVGTVGARQRIQHTVIGDAVNTASRLQDATKSVGHGIVMSESTCRAVQEKIECEPAGDIEVRGKREPIKVYTPKREK